MLPTPDLAQLDEVAVDAAFDRIVQIVSEYVPDLAADRGMLSDTVCSLHAILQTGMQQTVDSVRESMNIHSALAAPEDFCDRVVDSIASNYGVHRKPATRAVGTVIVVLQQEHATGLNLNAVFRANDKQFTINLVPPPAIAVPGGHTQRWATIINVKAAECGAASMLIKDTQLVPDRTPRGFVAAYVFEDFHGGYDSQSNESVIESIRHAVSAKVFSNRTNIRALIEHADPAICDATKLARILDISIVGMGDKEMTRDQRGILPISAGGRVDVYLRSQHTPASISFVKRPKLVETTDKYKIWSMSIDAKDATGFYDVLSVRPFGCSQGDDDCEICVVDRQCFIGGPGFSPDVRGLEDCGFSSYQAATVQFKQHNLDLDIEKFEVTLSVMPLVGELQDYLTHPDIRPPGTDILVRAAIPCWLSIDILLELSVSPEISRKLKTDVVACVHSKTFQNKLYSSTLSAIIAPLLADNNGICDIKITGTLIKPNGDTVLLEDTDPFIVATQDEDNISAKTTAMFLDSDKITITYRDARA